MKRDYTDGVTSSTVTKFIGKEVEMSLAYGLKTLFVISTETSFVRTFDFTANRVSHVYMNANHTDPLKINETDILYLQLHHNVRYMTIEVFNKEQFMYGQSLAAHYDKILIMWSVAIPNMKSIADRVTIKVDDLTFNHSNAGVYCMNASTFTNLSHETKWHEYTQDTPI